MTTILQITASIFGDEGQSPRLSSAFIAKWLEREPGSRVIRRDLAQPQIPHITLNRFKAALTPASDRTLEQVREAALADRLIEELIAADVLVIGVPIYNFNIPSTLKAWFDHVARAGTTFRYTDNGPVGLLKGKKAYIFAASGGRYAGTGMDFQSPYIRHFLNFLGIEDITFTYAEGLAMGEEATREALEAANERILDLVA